MPRTRYYMTLSPGIFHWFLVIPNMEQGCVNVLCNSVKCVITFLTNTKLKKKDPSCCMASA